MFPLIPFLVLGAVAGGAALLTRKSPGSPTVAGALPSPPRQGKGKFPGQLRQGNLYRVWVKLPAEYITQLRASAVEGQKALIADIQRQVESYGFAHTLLVTQDPTDNGVATVLTRWDRPEHEVWDADPVSLFHLESVEEPPAQAMLSIAPVPACLDEGLTPGEVEAIKSALETSVDPKHLTGFASTLEPYFPIAAGLLRAKAGVLVLRNAGSATIGQEEERIRSVGERLVTATNAVGWFGPEALQWSAARHAPGKALAGLTKPLGKAVTKSLTGLETGTKGWLPVSRVIAAEDALATAKSLQTGTRIGQVTLDDIPSDINVAQFHPLLSLVPKPGSGWPAMMIAGAALALSQPLSKADLHGDVAKQIPENLRPAFELGAGAGAGSVTRCADPAVHQLLESRASLSPDEQVVFDAGLALGRAQTLQRAGFRGLYLGTRGAGLGPRAGEFASVVTAGVKQGLSAANALVAKRRRDLQALSQESGVELDDIEKSVRASICAILKNGKLMRHGALESELKVSPAIAAAARSVVREAGENIRVVDAEACKRLLPSTGKEHLVSSAALQLAHAGAKPFTSGVLAPDRVIGVITDVRTAPNSDPKARKAKSELLKAQRTIERTRWVEWFRKASERGQGARAASSGTMNLTGRG